MLFLDEYGHRRDYTFEEVAAQSRRYAAVLRAFGVQAGDCVYVCLPKTAKCIFAMLALQRLGAEIVVDEAPAAGAKTIVADRNSRARMDAERERFSPDAHYVIIGEECEGWARLDTLAYVASNAPKPQPSADDEDLQSARDAAGKRLGAVPSDVVWCALENDVPSWLEEAVLQPWLAGCTTIAHNAPFDPRERLDLVRELNVTILIQHADEYHAELCPARSQALQIAAPAAVVCARRRL